MTELPCFLRLGAGVQRTTLALMAATGDLCPYVIDAAIFADTGWEPPEVYRHFDWLEQQLPFPLIRSTAGNLRREIFARVESRRFVAAPFFRLAPDGSRGRLQRQCTKDFKLLPIRRAAKALLGLDPTKPVRGGKPRCTMLLGIRTDEAIRQKPRRVKWIENAWPLPECRMSHRDCLQWLSGHQFPTPPKRACIGCPFHDDSYWSRMKATDPARFADACEVDAAIRNPRRFRGRMFLHRSCKPLGEVEFKRGSGRGFGEECEGLCGT